MLWRSWDTGHIPTKVAPKLTNKLVSVFESFNNYARHKKIKLCKKHSFHCHSICSYLKHRAKEATPVYVTCRFFPQVALQQGIAMQILVDVKCRNKHIFQCLHLSPVRQGSFFFLCLWWSKHRPSSQDIGAVHTKTWSQSEWHEPKLVMKSWSQNNIDWLFIQEDFLLSLCSISAHSYRQAL